MTNWKGYGRIVPAWSKDSRRSGTFSDRDPSKNASKCVIAHSGSPAVTQSSNINIAQNTTCWKSYICQKFFDNLLDWGLNVRSLLPGAATATLATFDSPTVTSLRCYLHFFHSNNPRIRQVPICTDCISNERSIDFLSFGKIYFNSGLLNLPRPSASQSEYQHELRYSASVSPSKCLQARRVWHNEHIHAVWNLS